MGFNSGFKGLIIQVLIGRKSKRFVLSQYCGNCVETVESYLKTELGGRKSKEFELETRRILYKPFELETRPILYKPFITTGPQYNDPQKYADISNFKFYGFTSVKESVRPARDIQWQRIGGICCFLLYLLFRSVFFNSDVCKSLLTFKNRASYIQDGRTATLQMLHFIYFFIKYKYSVF